MKNIFLIMSIVFSCFMFSGCVSGQAVSIQEAPSLNKRALAESLVQKDWNLFASFQRQGFSDRISSDFLPDKYAFLNEAEASFFGAVPVDLSFAIDKALIKNNKLAVTVVWQRKTANRESGNLTLTEGECTVVYRQENGQWLIYKIQGNSIFIF